jgi:5-methylcytosine-specific restriction endonuclease McrA
VIVCHECRRKESVPYGPRKDLILARRRARRKRKARLRGVESELYEPAAVAARDGHRCQICGRKVIMTLVVPHPRAPTMDHVIPLAEGGADTAANVRLAHFICNVKRGCRGGGEQLAIF